MLKKIISLVTLASFLLYSNAFIAPAILYAKGIEDTSDFCGEESSDQEDKEETNNPETRDGSSSGEERKGDQSPQDSGSSGKGDKGNNEDETKGGQDGEPEIKTTPTPTTSPEKPSPSPTNEPDKTVEPEVTPNPTSSPEPTPTSEEQPSTNTTTEEPKSEDEPKQTQTEDTNTSTSEEPSTNATDDTSSQSQRETTSQNTSESTTSAEPSETKVEEPLDTSTQSSIPESSQTDTSNTESSQTSSSEISDAEKKEWNGYIHEFLKTTKKIYDDPIEFIKDFYEWMKEHYGIIIGGAIGIFVTVKLIKYFKTHHKKHGRRGKGGGPRRPPGNDGGGGPGGDDGNDGGNGSGGKHGRLSDDYLRETGIKISIRLLTREITPLEQARLLFLTFDNNTIDRLRAIMLYQANQTNLELATLRLQLITLLGAGLHGQRPWVAPLNLDDNQIRENDYFKMIRGIMTHPTLAPSIIELHNIAIEIMNVFTRDTVERIIIILRETPETNPLVDILERMLRGHVPPPYDHRNDNQRYLNNDVLVRENTNVNRRFTREHGTPLDQAEFLFFALEEESIARLLELMRWIPATDQNLQILRLQLFVLLEMGLRGQRPWAERINLDGNEIRDYLYLRTIIQQMIAGINPNLNNIIANNIMRIFTHDTIERIIRFLRETPETIPLAEILARMLHPDRPAGTGDHHGDRRDPPPPPGGDQPQGDGQATGGTPPHGDDARETEPPHNTGDAHEEEEEERESLPVGHYEEEYIDPNVYSVFNDIVIDDLSDWGNQSTNLDNSSISSTEDMLINNNEELIGNMTTKVPEYEENNRELREL